MDSNLQSLCSQLKMARAIDLTHVLREGIPSYPTHAKYFQMKWQAMGDPAVMNQLILSEHSGTHVDSPSHFVTDRAHPNFLSIDAWAALHFIGRGVHVTLGPYSPESAMISVDGLRMWEKEHVSIESGDVVVFDFQWARRWGLDRDGFEYLEGWPGIDRGCAEYLVEKQVRCVGTDCVSLDSGDGGRGELPAHYTLLSAGICIVENLAHLVDVPVEFVFMAFPMKIGGGTGAPVRAIALTEVGVP